MYLLQYFTDACCQHLACRFPCHRGPIRLPCSGDNFYLDVLTRQNRYWRATAHAPRPFHRAVDAELPADRAAVAVQQTFMVREIGGHRPGCHADADNRGWFRDRSQTSGLDHTTKLKEKTACSKSDTRGTRLAPLASYFLFAHYHDPKQNGFSDLLVANYDRLAPTRGFGKHRHRDMKIVSYVLEGALGHDGTVIVRGGIQLMSAGTGVAHSQYNHWKGVVKLAVVGQLFGAKNVILIRSVSTAEETVQPCRVRRRSLSMKRCRAAFICCLAKR